MVPSCGLRSVRIVSVQSDLRRTGAGPSPARAKLPGALAPTRPHGSRPARPTPGGWLLRHSVALACAATLGVHLLSLTRQLGPDEGGFAMVARYAGTSGGYLYGPQWVDRPPGLIALFALADHLGPYGVRLTAAFLAVGLVAAVAWAAEAVGGRAAARWAAWTGFAFASSVLLQAQRLNGELAAATFVAVSIAALLRAVLASTTRTRTALLGLLAGASAALAVLMKQNFVDAFVFAGVLLLAGSATRANRLTYRPAAGPGHARRFRSGRRRSRRGDRVVGPRPRRHRCAAVCRRRVPCRRGVGDGALVPGRTTAPGRRPGRSRLPLGPAVPAGAPRA